jgi:hypothetical protein
MNNNPESTEKTRHSWKEYFNLGPVLGYYFRKKDPSRPNNFNLRMMHGINRISMIMFLICLIIIIVRRFF